MTMKPMRATIAMALVLVAANAGAQPAQPAPPPGPGAPAPAGAQPAPARPGAARAPAPTAEGPIPDPLAGALAPKPGGLTPNDAARAALKTRPTIRQKQADLRAAAARVDQALVGFFPRVSLTASYTRLSPINPVSLGGSIIGALNPGFVGAQACPPGVTPPPGGTCVIDQKGIPVQATPFAFPAPLVNNYSIVASVLLPISDYALRIAQNHASASHNETSKRLDAQATELQEAANAKITFFNWVQATGQVVVAREAVEQAQAHVEDARRSFDVGLASRADVLRLEAQVASAQQVQAESIAFAAVAEEQLRTTIGAPATQPVEIGVDVMHEPPVVPNESLAQLQQEAYRRRLELRSFDEAIASLKDVEAVTSASYVPRVDGFGDATYANPNPRIFPQQNQWDFTWDVGVRLSWTINDTFTTLGAAAEARARTESVAEQRATVRDGIRVEVASAYADVVKASAAIEAADRGVAASAESLRVRRELFRNGKGTAVDLVDAETELTRARLGQLQARVGLLGAKTRLEHATGRDVPAR